MYRDIHPHKHFLGPDPEPFGVRFDFLLAEALRRSPAHQRSRVAARPSDHPRAHVGVAASGEETR